MAIVEASGISGVLITLYMCIMELHRVPPPIESSVQGFLSAFERQYANIDDAMQCESIRSFVRSFGNIFSAHVILFLLYQSEKDISETIRANPLRPTCQNQPAKKLRKQ